MVKRSVIWNLPKDELRTLVEKSNTFASILRHFGLTNKGRNTDTLKRRLRYENIDYSHIPQGPSASRGRANFVREAMPNEQVFVKHSTYGRTHLRHRVIKDSLIPYECSICKNNGTWMEKTLTLRLDHINGISDDHRLSNLRFLCPNCDSQTDTFGGKNINFNRSRQKHCCEDCGINTKGYSKLCHRCARRKGKIPSKDELQKLVLAMPITHVGKIFGVSDKAVHKWCTRLNVRKMPFGHWNRGNIPGSNPGGVANYEEPEPVPSSVVTRRRVLS